MAKDSVASANSLIGEIKIIYEDEDILAIDKPAGLMVHGDGRSSERTVADWVLEKYPSAKDVGESLVIANGKEVLRPGIVHRIDRWTSGVLLIAKSKEAHAYLKKQFQGREIKKEYQCFVYGKVKNDFGTINAPLGRSKGDFRQYTTPAKARGEMREAISYYEVLKRGSEATLLKVEPKTGRTHQIRAHMVHLGYPIVCDKTYAKRDCILGFSRMALHARSVTFRNLEGKEIRVEAAIPADFLSAEEELAIK